MTVAYSPNDLQVRTGLQAWIMDTLGLPMDHVVLERDNKVAMPATGFVQMTRSAQKRLSTNVASYEDQPAATPAVEAEVTLQAVDYAIQVDCYGPQAADWAGVLSTMFWSTIACEFLEAYGIDPLYLDDPIPLPLVNGEQQYEERWSLKLHLQYNPAMTTPMQFMGTAKVTLINVETLPR